jgi:hypothetical protein
MKRISTCLLIITAAMASLMPQKAHAQFTINGEFRMRPEYRDGYALIRDSSKTPFALILGRARVGFDYKTDKIQTCFSLQDAFVFGQNNYGSDTISKNTVNMFEAWFRYIFSKSFAFKIGRTQVYYDDERFLGKSDWSMWGATHDIMIAQWETGKKYNGDFGFAVNNVAPATIPFLSSYTLNNYKYMSYLYEKVNLWDNKLSFSLLGLMDAFQSTNTSTKVTYDTLKTYDQTGTVIGYSLKKNTSVIYNPNQLYARGTLALDGWLTLNKFTAFASGAYQGGHYRDGRKLSAWFYSANVAYQFVKQFKLMVGYDHLDGNDFSKTTDLKTKVTGFNTLYGTAHRLYGYMDEFNAYVRDNLQPGLNDLYARATFNITDKMFIEGTFRWFSLAHGYLNIADKVNNTAYTAVDKNLGQEIDLMYNWKVLPNFDLNAAYCFFLPTHTMEMLKGIAPGKSEYAQYVYVMVTYKPNFFTSEKK